MGSIPEHILHKGVAFETHEGHHPGIEIEPKETKSGHEFTTKPGETKDVQDRYYSDMHVTSEPLDHIWHHTVGQPIDHHTEPHYLGTVVHEGAHGAWKEKAIVPSFDRSHLKVWHGRHYDQDYQGDRSKLHYHPYGVTGAYYEVPEQDPYHDRKSHLLDGAFDRYAYSEEPSYFASHRFAKAVQDPHVNTKLEERIMA